MPRNIGRVAAAAQSSTSYLGNHMAGFTCGSGCAIRCGRHRAEPAFCCAISVVDRQEIRTPVQVIVRDNNVDQALRVLKKKMQREGVFREMKLRRAYEKPSERRAREKAEALRRHRKLMRKRMEREGF